MPSGWKQRARTWSSVAAVGLLGAATMSLVAPGEPVAAYEVTTTGWSHPSSTAATDTAPSGLVTTVNLTGQVAVDSATTARWPTTQPRPRTSPRTRR